MGNYSDSELLYCNDKLDNICVDLEMLDIKDVKHTLKPQHLLFDGLDEEYEFSTMNTDVYECIKDPNIININIDWKMRLSDSDDSTTDDEYHIYDEYERISGKNIDDDDYDSDRSGWTIDDFRGIRNWQTHNGLDAIEIPKDDIYCGLYYENLDHNWSLPERDEMDDLQEKINHMNINDYNNSN